MFKEGAANILLITPIVMPVLTAAGFDPIHKGVLLMFLINIGGLTPPIGVIMFTVCGGLNVKTGAYTRAAPPFFLAFLVFYVVLAAFPAISTAPPSLLM